MGSCIDHYLLHVYMQVTPQGTPAHATGPDAPVPRTRALTVTDRERDASRESADRHSAPTPAGTARAQRAAAARPAPGAEDVRPTVFIRHGPHASTERRCNMSPSKNRPLVSTCVYGLTPSTIPDLALRLDAVRSLSALPHGCQLALSTQRTLPSILLVVLARHALYKGLQWSELFAAHEFELLGCRSFYHGRGLGEHERLAHEEKAKDECGWARSSPPRQSRESV